MPWPLMILCALIALAGSRGRAAADERQYLQDVKPLLEQKCYACHGAIRQHGGLRVDTAADLLQGGDSGSPVDRSDPDDSLLLQVLTGTAGFRMPPESDGAPLTDTQIAMIRDWIAAGASAPADEQRQADPADWWSHRPLRRPAVPEVGVTDWSRRPLDRFIERKRREAQLPSVPDASRERWLRRVTLDLIGLPPTRAELARFRADLSEDARERVVDDLLDRPEYGERWGRHWMDIWRYSDWYGSRGNGEVRYSQRHIWRWRDWIVDSLNADHGYDRMVRDMLAADEFAGDDPARLPATGFLARNWYKFDRDAWLFETVERTGEAFLGMTFRCCRCHDHKYDPVTQREYYRFRAVFEPHDVRIDPVAINNGVPAAADPADTDADGIARVFDRTPHAATYRLERGDSRSPDESEQLTPGVPAALGGELIVEAVPLPVAAWYPALRPGVRNALLAHAQHELADAEQAMNAARARVDEAAAALEAHATASPQSATGPVFLEDSFAGESSDLWETVSGEWARTPDGLRQDRVTEFATIVTAKDHPGDVDVRLRYTTLEPGTYRSVGFSFDYQDQGNSQDVYTSTGRTAQSVQAFHRTNGRQVYPPEAIVRTSLQPGVPVELTASIEGSQLTLSLNGDRVLDYRLPLPRRPGRFALWVHQGAAVFHEVTVTQRALSRESLVREVELAERNGRLAELAVEVARAELAAIDARLTAERAKYAADSADPAFATAAALAERRLAVARARQQVAETAGQPSPHADALAALRAAEQAAEEPSTDYSPLGPQFPPTSTGRRRALAEWITDPANPRTARVAVNHIWGRHFGTPLVATPENFGLNGATPTHPKLLDWLAAELIEADWKMKPLHRMIVLSATYRMDSAIPAVTEDSAAVAFDRARETDPDNRLYWRMPSRRMEAELVRDATLAIAGTLDRARGGPELPASEGESCHRRSLYFRNTPNESMPLLTVFDMANPNACYRRRTSVVPNQSLAMMNSGLTQDAARTVAARLSQEPDFLVAAFETILGRAPDPVEARRCREFLTQQAQRLADSSGPRFPAGGTAQIPPSSDPAVRARENLVQALFLHNDFVTIR